MTKQNFGRTILVVTALSEERKAVISFLDSIKIEKDDYGLSFVSGSYPSFDTANPWRIILPAPTRAGNVKSAAKTALSLSVDPDMIFLVGCAGGFPRKVNKFDVVVAERVFYVEPAKIDFEESYIPRPDAHKVTSKLLSRAQSLQDVGGWEKLLHPDAPNEPIEVWIEPIAAGEKLVASSSSDEFDLIKKNAPRAVAVENEGFGVLEAAHEAAINALVIRGISDLLDDRPKETCNSACLDDSRATQDPDKFKATRHAAAFMFGVISLLDDEDLNHFKKVEDEFVMVKMRWKDLKDISKGRQLIVDLTEGAPISDVKIISGSIVAEFKTLKLFATLLYATWIEENVFGSILKEEPDLIETLIDTSDAEVASVFKTVRLLNSSDTNLRLKGKEMIDELAKRHPMLLVFSSKLVDAVDRRDQEIQKLPSIAVSENLVNNRISISISESALEAITQLQKALGVQSRAEATRKLLHESLKDYQTHGSISTLLAENSRRHKYVGRVSLSLDDYDATILAKESSDTGLRPADIARSLINISASKKPERAARRGYRIERLREIRERLGITKGRRRARRRGRSSSRSSSARW